MQNKNIKKYHFESTHAPYSIKQIEVEITEENIIYNVDNVIHIVNFLEKSLIRKNEEMEMLFDFETSTGYIKLLEVNSNLPFKIVESDLKYENDILHLDFKYILEEEVFVSLSII